MLLVASVAASPACAPKFNSPGDRTVADHDALSGESLVAVIVGDPELSTFAGLVKLSGATQVLQLENPYFTVFAPSNDAFDALPEGYLDKLTDPANRELLTAVVTHHVLEERMASGAIPTVVFESLYGNDVNLGRDGDRIVINDATVVRADLEASNGVVHVIDKVLIPQR